MYPTKVHVREVGPRDGFQNEPETIPTAVKLDMIHRLVAAGFERIEVASFVRPDVLPQLADAEAVLNGIDVPSHVGLAVLVPNLRGLELALRQKDRFHEAVLFVSASETHNARNVNSSVASSMSANARIAATVLDEGLTPTAVIATSFGCPFEGAVPKERVAEIAAAFVAAGADEVGFGDTTGMANPRQVEEFFGYMAEQLPGTELTAHFHNTRGQGLANAVAALRAGCTSFEASFGELGGCPVPAGSTGNIATEDLISMFHEMGVDTGIDLPAVIDAARAMQDHLGRTLTSHSLVAGPIDWTPEVLSTAVNH